MYCFGSIYTKFGTIQRRLAWPLRKDDTQNREAFHIFLSALYQSLTLSNFFKNFFPNLMKDLGFNNFQSYDISRHVVQGFETGQGQIYRFLFICFTIDSFKLTYLYCTYMQQRGLKMGKIAQYNKKNLKLILPKKIGSILREP